ncbi:hypothetical protein GCM10022202_26370 [Microbacterium marinilacus]|uniref:Uncharacterized protein n=1 Tax=Microbacterium marinilacus TaxID=415209 RepID=A0ABP7BKF8_9MICO
MRDLGPAAEFQKDDRPRGLSPDRVRRVFRGETAAQLADIAYWATLFPEVGEAVAQYLSTWRGGGIASGDNGDPDAAGAR